MKSKDIKSLSQADLIAKLKSENELLEKLKLSHAISPIENPMRIRLSRRFVASLKTELTSRNN